MYLIRNIDQATNPIKIKTTFDQYVEPEQSANHELGKLF